MLETERGNVFLVEPDGTLVTPPLRDDLLPGVTRRALLDLARDTGRPTDCAGSGSTSCRQRRGVLDEQPQRGRADPPVDGIALPRPRTRSSACVERAVRWRSSSSLARLTMMTTATRTTIAELASQLRPALLRLTRLVRNQRVDMSVTLTQLSAMGRCESAAR